MWVKRIKKTEEREIFQTELFCKTMLSAAVDSGPISLPWMRLHSQADTTNN